VKANAYTHPALAECSTTRTINCIASSIIQKSKFVQVITSIGNDERNIVVVPRKIFPHDVIPGQCYSIKGEDRYKKHYGDILVSAHVSQSKPDISLFASFAAYNFHLLSEIVIRRIIESDKGAFIQALTDHDIQFFVEHSMTPYVARKFLQFSISNLFCEKNEAVQIDN
jgi:hypothetical protein